MRALPTAMSETVARMSETDAQRRVGIGPSVIGAGAQQTPAPPAFHPYLFVSTQRNPTSGAEFVPEAKLMARRAEERRAVIAPSI